MKTEEQIRDEIIRAAAAAGITLRYIAATKGGIGLGAPPGFTDAPESEHPRERQIHATLSPVMSDTFSVRKGAQIGWSLNVRSVTNPGGNYGTILRGQSYDPDRQLAKAIARIAERIKISRQVREQHDKGVLAKELMDSDLSDVRTLLEAVLVVSHDLRTRTSASVGVANGGRAVVRIEILSSEPDAIRGELRRIGEILRGTPWKP